MLDELIKSELEQLPAVLRVKEVATYLRLPLSRCYELVASGEIDSIRFGRSVRIPRQALVDLFERASEHGCE
ncbi:MAG: helix-turn-helix domain-containing protein [Bacillota bacterium]|jgi:excisionase family DNA binding protein